MQPFSQWLAEASSSPSKRDYESLLRKWQGREERKGVWYVPFLRDGSSVVCLSVSERFVGGKLTFHIGSHFYECRNVNGRFAADIWGSQEIDAKVLRQGEDSLSFLEELISFAVKTKDPIKIAKLAREGSLKASVAWHDKND